MLLAIPVTDTALIKYSSALSPPSLYSLILTLPLASQCHCTGLILAGNQAQFAQYFRDCCTVEKKNNKKMRNDCIAALSAK